MPSLVERHHAPVDRERVDYECEVEGRPGVSVTEHQGRDPGGPLPRSDHTRSTPFTCKVSAEVVVGAIAPV